MVVVGDYVLHVEHLVAGKIVKIWEPGTYSKNSPAPIDARVVELDNGHAFIDAEGIFEVLNDQETEFHQKCVQVITHSMVELVRYGIATKIDRTRGVFLLAEALKSAARAAAGKT
jgi:hypothetical protein